MAEKKTHFGRAGEYFAMSELLLRGWNVAVPVVDIGDDVFVIDDNDKTTHRLQVKSATPDSVANGITIASFSLSRAQLRTPQAVELFFMLLVRESHRWRFLVIPRLDLSGARDAFVEQQRPRGRAGRKPVADDAAKTDALRLTLTFTADAVEGWDADLTAFLGRWPAALAPVAGGPGAGAAVVSAGVGPGRSPGPEK